MASSDQDTQAVEDPHDSYMRELLDREMRGERAPIDIGPHTAIMLFGAIQAVRPAQLACGHGPAMFEQVLEQLRSIFVDDPAATAVLQRYEPPPPEQLAEANPNHDKPGRLRVVGD